MTGTGTVEVVKIAYVLWNKASVVVVVVDVDDDVVVVVGSLTKFAWVLTEGEGSSLRDLEIPGSWCSDDLWR